jgi:hypothetical protein
VGSVFLKRVAKSHDEKRRDSEGFARTSRKSGDGAYLKIAPVWAEVAGQAGSLPTKEA